MSRIDNLEFLSDVIPKTTTVREYKEKKAKTIRPNARLSSGQTTLDSSKPLPTRPADVLNSAETQMAQSNLSPGGPVGDHGLEDARVRSPSANGEEVFHYYEPNGHPDRHDSEDVEME